MIRKNAWLQSVIVIILIILLFILNFIVPIKHLHNYSVARGLILEKATTPSQRQTGLSGRDKLAGNRGMVFIFEDPSQQCIWMKDMKFPLDIIWLDQDDRVINIADDVRPETFPNSFCAENTKYVIEVNSGIAKHLNLKIGEQFSP